MRLSWLWSKTHFWGLLVFGIPLLVYLATLAPSVTAEDSGELITAAATLGIPHPPGYPLYVILGKLFTFMPWGEVAWRMNLMSAVAGAGAIYMLYRLVWLITQSKPASILSAWSLAFSLTFWSQSVIAEVYTLHVLLGLGVLMLCLRWYFERQDRWLYIASFGLGLGATNHQLMFLLAPAVLLFVVISDLSWLQRFRRAGVCLALWLLGLALYLFVPLRSLADPVLDWGNPETWSGFWLHITRAQYGDLGGWALGSGKLPLVAGFYAGLPAEFGWVLVGLASLGFIVSWREWRLAWLWLGALLSQTLLVVALRSFDWGLSLEQAYPVYYLLAFAVVALYIGLGFNAGVTWVRDHWPKVNTWLKERRLATSLLVSLTLLPAAYLLVRHFQFNDYHSNYLVRDFATTLLTSVPRGGILVLKQPGSAGDTEVFSVLYVQAVLGVRPDVKVIEDVGANPRPQGLALLPRDYYQKGFLEQRADLVRLALGYAGVRGLPIVTTFPTEALGLKLWGRATGVSYAVFTDQVSTRRASVATIELPLRSQGQLRRISLRYAERDTLAHMLYLRAGFELERGFKYLAVQRLIEAITYDNTPRSYEYADYLAHRAWWGDQE